VEEVLENAGALATAAAVAHQIDPPAAPPGAGHAAHGGACLNCGATLGGDYCSHCGQQAHIHRSLAHAVEELLHGVWHFDSKLWNTLPLLLLRPGKLTRDYVMGKRARYISPMGLFLLTIFLMFFVFGLTGGVKMPTDTEIKAAGQQLVATPDGKKRLAEIDRSLGEIERDLAAARADPKRADDVVALEAMSRGLRTSRQLVLGTPGSKPVADDSPAWAAAVRAAADSNSLDIDLGDQELNRKARHALKNPELALYKVQQKGYKLSFLLLPLSLPWMLLLFAWRRDVKAYDHVVFLLYSISFMSMLAVAVVLLAVAGVTAPLVYVALVAVLPPVHMFLQMKGAYQLSPFSALWRTSVLVLMSIITLALYFSLIVALGLLD
jgi:hypothetical protein